MCQLERKSKDIKDTGGHMVRQKGIVKGHDGRLEGKQGKIKR